MKIRIRFSGYTDVEVSDGLSGEALEYAIGKAWAKEPTPEGTDYDDAVRVDDDGDEHQLDCKSDHCHHYDCSSYKDEYAYCTRCDPEVYK